LEPIGEMKFAHRQNMGKNLSFQREELDEAKYG
jgi:hypothetical protein